MCNQTTSIDGQTMQWPTKNENENNYLKKLHIKLKIEQYEPH